MFSSEDWKKEPEERIISHPFSNISMTPDKIISILSSDNIDMIRQTIKTHHEMIMSAIFLENNKVLFEKITDSKENLSTFTQAIQNVDRLISSEIQQLNDLVYGFFSKSEARENLEKWNSMKTYYLQISKSINKTHIAKLMKYVPEDLAALLCSARFSSHKEITQAKRVNNVLIKQDPKFLTEQKIIDIYLSLYDHITPLFNGVMCDYRNPEKMSDIESENWSMIDLSLLDIIENMPIKEIIKVIESLHNLITMGYVKKLKFNLYSINSADYGRTCSVIEQVFSSKANNPYMG